MTKSELVRVVAKREGITIGQSEKVVSAVFDVIGYCLACHETVKVPRFGTFEPRPHRAVTRRDPRNGTPIQIPAKVGVGFVPSAHLKAKVSSDAP